MKIAGTPLFRHADKKRHCVENDGDDGEREETNAQAVPQLAIMQINADAAEHGDGSESVSLPTQIIELEAAVDRGQRECEKSPAGGEPAGGGFVPHQEGEQEGGSRGGEISTNKGGG